MAGAVKALPFFWEIFQCLQAEVVTGEENETLSCSMCLPEAVATAGLIKETQLRRAGVPFPSAKQK